MGNNTKGLYLCETIYPPDNGVSCIPPEKLEKAIKKGEIPPQVQADEEDVDGNMDEVIDNCIREVWQYYDPKGMGSLNKKQTQQFFKDALNLVALRKMCKSKDLFQGRKEGAALDEAVDFLTGGNSEHQIDTHRVEMVDNSELPSGGGPVKGKIEYRDYGALQD